MPYKNKEDRLRWAREKYARSEHTRILVKEAVRRNRKLNKQKSKGAVKGDANFYKRQARDLVKAAIKYKRLVRLPCEVCGELKSQAHHEDYNAPLEVRFLCEKHHKELHRKKT